MRLFCCLCLAVCSAAPNDSNAAADLLQTARGNLKKVSLAMETVTSLARQERVRLRDAMQALKESYATKVKKMHKYMQADAEINNVPIATLDPAGYGIGLAPMKTAPGLLLISQAGMCARAIKLGTGVSALILGLDKAQKPTDGVAVAVNNTSAMLLDEQLAMHIKVNTDSFGTKVKKLQHDAVTAKIQSEVDSQVIQFLKQLAMKNEAKKAADAAAEKKAQDAAWKAVTGQEGTPIAAALHRLKLAETRMHAVFTPVIAEATCAGQVASSAIQAIDAAGLLGAKRPAVATAALQRILSILRSAMAVLQTVVPVKSAFSVQYSHVGTILSREQGKLRRTMKSSMAHKLSLSLSDPKFMELTKEYDEELKLKKAAHELCNDVQKACRDPGYGRWADAPKEGARAAAGGGGGDGSESSGGSNSGGGSSNSTSIGGGSRSSSAVGGGLARRLRELVTVTGPASPSTWGFATGSVVGAALFATAARARTVTGTCMLSVVS